MAKELMEIGGFITEGAEIVNHDNTLSGNGTVDSPLGVSETVLYDDTPTNSDITLSENCTNFEYIELYGVWDYNGSEDSGRGVHIYAYAKVPSSAISFQITGVGLDSLTNISTGRYYVTTLNYRPNATQLIKLASCRSRMDGTNTSLTDTLKIFKVVGINRKAQ